MPKTHQDEALDDLRDILKDVDTIYTVLTYVSQDGMTRYIMPLIIREKKIINISRIVIAAGVGSTPRRRNGQGVSVGGTGMDMGFHLVYSISQVAYGAHEGYKINHRWL